jgi:hypothetical protein
VIWGLLLALGSAALINLGFLLQHRGLTAHAGLAARARLRHAIREPAWLAGQALGWIGFAVQIAAVAIAPLSLVQAFAAGGLALSVPLAAGVFHHPITRAQLAAVLLIAVGLAALPLGLSRLRDHVESHPLILVLVLGALVGAALVRVPAPVRASARALAAGIFYGLADAAIKAVSLGWHGHGASALLSGWTAVALVGTLAGFLAFQSALEGDAAVASISLMSAGAALMALGCGLVAFGESLGGSAAATVAHLLAIGVVLGTLPVLAGAQAAIVQSADERDQRPSPRARPVPAMDRLR